MIRDMYLRKYKVPLYNSSDFRVLQRDTQYYYVNDYDDPGKPNPFDGHYNVGVPY